MMYRAAVTRRAEGSKLQVAQSFSVPVPTGGINARDAFTDMKPEDAVSMVNVFPEASNVVVRGGYTEAFNTDSEIPVRTLLVWNGLTGVDQIFAATGDNIVDSAGDTQVTGIISDKLQWTNIENAAGMFLVSVNGVSPVNEYDGAAWTQPTITSIDSVDSDKFVNVCQFKERLWFAVIDSLDLYYLDLQAIAGTATLFPLGAVVRRGGYVIGLGTFSNDAGEGPDDYFAIATSNGEVVVYEGTDPNSITTWSLAGIFQLGKPIGRRCMARISGDLTVITQDGVISLQAALRFAREEGQKAAITAKIQTLFSTYSQAYFTNFGWQPCVFPRTRYMIVNVPAVGDMVQTQLVMNTITGSWCEFKNWNAGCWAVANDKLYFGGNDGIVYEAAIGYLDNGSVISWSVQTAWQKHSGDTNKIFTMVRPVMLSGGAAQYGITINVDFYPIQPSPGLSGPLVSGMTWPWTWPGTWGGQNVLVQNWQSAGAIGTWACINQAGTINGAALAINNYELVCTTGGVL